MAPAARSTWGGPTLTVTLLCAPLAVSMPQFSLWRSHGAGSAAGLSSRPEDGFDSDQ